MAYSDLGICAIFLGDDLQALLSTLKSYFPKVDLYPAKSATILQEVIEAVENPMKHTNFSLDIRGTRFQHLVWDALRTIPVGQTISYLTLAKQIAKPKAVRAVAKACAANRLAVLIPCHRVIRQNGSLSGYRWGISRKQALLNREMPS